MKDDRGLYYFPFPGNKHVRMYVRQGPEEIQFRMWNQDDPQMWESHGWVPHLAIVQALAFYKGGPFDPKKAYDLNLAKALLKEGA
ncbi:MAG: hypothetical protein WAU91_17530 [Desulfatitalea sp.]